MSAIKELQAKLKISREHTTKIMALDYVSKAGFRRGALIRTMNQFVYRLSLKKPFYFNHKFMAAGFIEHWSFYQVQSAINHNQLVCAVKVKRN